MSNVGDNENQSFANAKVNYLTKDELVNKLLELETNSEEKARNIAKNVNESISVSEALKLFSDKLKAASSLQMYESVYSQSTDYSASSKSGAQQQTNNYQRSEVVQEADSAKKKKPTLKLSKDQMQILHDKGEVEIDGQIIKYEESAESPFSYKAQSIKESINSQINESVWPKADLSDEYQRKLEQALEDNFDEDFYFYVVGTDLYMENKELMDDPEEPILTINPENEEPMDIVKMVERQLETGGLYLDEAKKKGKGKSIAKIQKEWANVTSKMKEKAEEYKKADEDEKEKIKKELKELTAQKKELEDEMNKSVQQKDADVDLEIGETNAATDNTDDDVHMLVNEYLRNNNKSGLQPIKEQIQDYGITQTIDHIMEKCSINDNGANRREVGKTLLK
jgi:hypothetical protein